MSPDTAKARPSTVSEQVQSEKLRLEIAAIVKLSDDAILSQTLDGIITSWNPAATRLYGYTDDEIVGQSVARLIPPDRNYELEEILTELRCGRRVERYDTVRIRKDGTRIDVSITTSLLKNEHGTVVGASTLARDIGSRKATQAALDQSEKQYREFVETAHEAVWTTDADGNTSFVNAQMAEMIGYPIDEIVGRPLSGFMDDEGKSISTSNMERRRQGIREQLDFKFQRKDGSELWALLDTKPITDAAGAYAGMLSTVIDITAHRRVEERSRLNANVVENMQIGLIVFRLERPDDFTSLRLISSNHAASAFMGFDLGEVIGKPILDALPALRGTELPEIYLDGAQRQIARELGEVPYKDENMISGYYSYKVFPLPDSCVGVAFENVTAHKQAVDALAQAKERFATAFQSSPVALAITRISDHRVLDVNDASEHLLGYRREDLMGAMRPELDFIVDPNERDQVAQLLARDGRVRDFETTVTTPSGNLSDVLCSLETIQLEGDACILASYVDITQRKHMEREIRELNVGLEQRVEQRTTQLDSANKRLSALNHELETFAYSVSHDLRAPLRHIDGFSKALENHYSAALDERGLHYLARIRTGTKRMGGLIDDLLALSRFTRSELHVTTVDLTRIAREVAAELQSEDPLRQAEWVIADGMTARGDERLLHVALTNLLGNAWKFSQHTANAWIELTSEQVDGEDRYIVRDNGAGFDMAHADKLFSSFGRLHTSDEFEGTGIGLATVQRIVHRHGGHIAAEGAVGRGATISFTLQVGS